MRDEDRNDAQPDQEVQVLSPSRGEVLVQSAEISQQVATARSFPRRSDPEIAREIVTRATFNDDIAGECMFLLPRGGKTIPGPSIRFAEIVRASYGNIRVATRFVRLDTDDRDNCAVIVEAIAYDMQTNNSETVFERRSVMTSARGNSKPKMYTPDMIAQTAGAARSIARRNAILAVVPKALWIDGYYEAVQVTQGAENFQDRRDKAFAGFKKLGAQEPAVCAALGLKEIGQITLEHMPMLMAMWTAIKDGESPASVFERLGVEVAKHEVVNNPLKETAQTVRGSSAAEAADPKEQLRDGPDPKPKAAEIAVEVEQSAGAKLPSNEMQPDASQQTTKPAEIEGPADSKAYEDTFISWLPGAKSESSIRDRWGKEAPLRKKLGVDADAIERLATAKEKRMAELRAAAGT